MDGQVALSEKDRALLKKKMEEHFWFFANATMDAEFFDHTFHRELCDFLQQPLRNKLVVMPRSFLKTTIVTRYLLWRALRNPNIRILIVCNTATNAEKSLAEIMGLIEKHPLIRGLWPEVIPDFRKTKWSTNGATLNRTGTYPECTFEAAGVGSRVIRRHFNIVAQDDTVTPDSDSTDGEDLIPTREEIDKAIGFHKLTMPLLVKAEEDERLVIGTRWASEDLIEYVQEEEGFPAFNRPATSDGTLEGKPTYFRFGPEILKEIQRSVGSFMFEALYMNSPKPKEFMSFQPSWFQYWDKLPEEGLRVVTVDPADPPTGRKTQDYSAIVSCVFSKEGLFVVDVDRARMTPKQIVCRTLDLAKRDEVDKVRVEVDRHAYLKEEFYDEMERRKWWVGCEFVKTQGRQKNARILALQPLYESGRVWHPKGEAARKVEAELVSFPYGKHDDVIDALAWQLSDYRRALGEPEKPREKKIAAFKFEIGFEDVVDELQEKFRARRRWGRVPAGFIF